MTCAACAARIEKVLNRTDGVQAAVNFATETAHVEFDAARVTPQALIEAVRKAGYDAAPAVDPFAQPEQDARAEASRYRRELSRFVVAALLTAPLVLQMFAMVTDRHDLALPIWLQFALAAPVQFWAGARFYAGSWKALSGGAANMDVLVALGTTAAFAFSVAVWLVPLAGQHVYFEAGAVVITLVLLGKLLEGRAKAKTASAIRDLLKLQPPTVLRERDGEIREVPLAAVRARRRLPRSRRGQRGGGRPRAGRRIDGERGDADRRERAGRRRLPALRCSPARSTSTGRCAARRPRLARRRCSRRSSGRSPPRRDRRRRCSGSPTRFPRASCRRCW